MTNMILPALYHERGVSSITVGQQLRMTLMRKRMKTIIYVTVLYEQILGLCPAHNLGYFDLGMNAFSCLES